VLNPLSPPVADPRVLATTLAHFDLDWVLVGELATRAYAWPTEPALALLPPEVTTVVPRGGDENLERLAESLFALEAVPLSGPDAAWSPWPATSDHLAGDYATRAGRVRILAAAAYERYAEPASTAILGGVPVRVARPSGAAGAAVRPSFPRHLAEGL
jgi:hypothetical protein